MSLSRSKAVRRWLIPWKPTCLSASTTTIRSAKKSQGSKCSTTKREKHLPQHVSPNRKNLAKKCSKRSSNKLEPIHVASSKLTSPLSVKPPCPPSSSKPASSPTPPNAPASTTPATASPSPKASPKASTPT